MGEEAERYAAPALDKGLDIIELLSLATEPMSMGQIAERLSRSKSEIFRMLVALERRRYIVRDEAAERFEIGHRLFELAMRVPPTRNLVAIAVEHIESAARELDQSCHLAVLSGTQIVVLARSEAPGELGFAVRLGYRRRIDQSTSGRVITAFSSPAIRDGLIRRLADEYADFDQVMFEQLLEAAVRQGFERGPSHSVKGVTDIGAPIFGESGWAVACLTVPFIHREHGGVSLEQARDVVLREAQAISAQLGLGMPNHAPATPADDAWSPASANLTS